MEEKLLKYLKGRWLNHKETVEVDNSNDYIPDDYSAGCSFGWWTCMKDIAHHLEIDLDELIKT